LRTCASLSWPINFPSFIEPEDSLQSSQNLATVSYLKRNESWWDVISSTVASMNMAVFRFVAPCSTYKFTDVSKATGISETSLNFHQATRCKNPEDSRLHTNCVLPVTPVSNALLPRHTCHVPYKPKYLFPWQALGHVTMQQRVHPHNSTGSPW
jgi:hypothetical protein